MTGYLLNSRKRPLYKSKDQKYAYDFRFYFTSAKIMKAHVKSTGGNDFADANPGNANDVTLEPTGEMFEAAIPD